MHSKKKFQNKKQQSNQKSKQQLQQDKICGGEILCLVEEWIS